VRTDQNAQDEIVSFSDLNRGQVELLRADGAKLAAEFAATMNMLPGRHLLQGNALIYFRSTTIWRELRAGRAH
jgi:hypothetical protein